MGWIRGRMDGCMMGRREGGRKMMGWMMELRWFWERLAVGGGGGVGGGEEDVVVGGGVGGVGGK